MAFSFPSLELLSIFMFFSMFTGKLCDRSLVIIVFGSSFDSSLAIISPCLLYVDWILVAY